MISLLDWPKVITLSGFYCMYKVQRISVITSSVTTAQLLVLNVIQVYSVKINNAMLKKIKEHQMLRFKNNYRIE
jgi:hypothetical protein